MASYVVVSGTIEGVGHKDIVAIVIDDGHNTEVLGTTLEALDIEDNADAFADGDPIERLRGMLHGMTYYNLDGPHDYDGTAKEAADPLAIIYGLG